MSHLLPRGVVEAVDEVDFMVKESGLGDGGRDDRNLYPKGVSCRSLGLNWLSAYRTVSLSSNRIFILEDEDPVADSPAVTILEM